MKSPRQVVAEIAGRLDRRWHEGVTTASTDWPWDVALGKPSKQVLQGGFAAARTWALDWEQWAKAHAVVLRWENRLVSGTQQGLPTHVTIPDIETAARLVGKGWSARLETAMLRHAHLAKFFPLSATPAVLRSVDSLTDADFDLLCHAATWFAANDATGLTPRQVAIEGLHGKWLNTNISLVRTLAGKADLGLIDRPAIAHFTYLDLSHLLAGGRKHDSTTVADVEALAYIPSVVIVCENKDSAVYFPSVAGGIAVQGAGFEGASTLARIGWLKACPSVFYWGDIDAAGFEIVNRFRANGIDATTILMDRNTFEEHEVFGASTDKNGKPLARSVRKALQHLTQLEQDLYSDLTDPTWPRVRRVEQERIPLDLARQAVLNAVARA
jgi:hypothetical protein